MSSGYVIRKLDWSRCDKNGVPQDFLDIKEFYNRALDKNLIPLIRRQSKITYKELRDGWLKKKNAISFVAYSKKYKKVIGSCTVTEIGKELAITLDPEHSGKGLGYSLTRKSIVEAKKRAMTIVVTTSVENKPMIRIMEKLGYKAKRRVKNYQPYVNVIKAKSFDAFEWVISPRDVK